MKQKNDTDQAWVFNPQLDVEVWSIGKVADQAQTTQTEQEHMQAEEGDHKAWTSLFEK